MPLSAASHGKGAVLQPDCELDTETHRHRCWVRQLIVYRREWGLQKFREYVKGMKAWPEIQKDFVDQWRKGNTGKDREWR